MFFVKSYLLGCSLLPSIRMNLVLTHSKDDKIYTLDMKKILFKFAIDAWLAR